jgi:bacterioferritin
MATTANLGILDPDRAADRASLVDLLTTAYWMEMETVMNYTASSINPDGVRAQEVIESLAEDVAEEMGHARELAMRIKELHGVVPGSAAFTPSQLTLQPPEHQTDIVHVIRGVIDAENAAIAHYLRIVDFAGEVDPVTEDMVIGLLRDEQKHLRLFEGFLREYQAEGAA